MRNIYEKKQLEEDGDVWVALDKNTKTEMFLVSVAGGGLRLTDTQLKLLKTVLDKELGQ